MIGLIEFHYLKGLVEGIWTVISIVKLMLMMMMMAVVFFLLASP
jgi:hypothetical protein